MFAVGCKSADTGEFKIKLNPGFSFCIAEGHVVFIITEDHASIERIVAYRGENAPPELVTAAAAHPRMRRTGSRKRLHKPRKLLSVPWTASKRHVRERSLQVVHNLPILEDVFTPATQARHSARESPVPRTSVHSDNSPLLMPQRAPRMSGISVGLGSMADGDAGGGGGVGVGNRPKAGSMSGSETSPERILASFTNSGARLVVDNPSSSESGPGLAAASIGDRSEAGDGDGEQDPAAALTSTGSFLVPGRPARSPKAHKQRSPKSPFAQAPQASHASSDVAVRFMRV